MKSPHSQSGVIFPATLAFGALMIALAIAVSGQALSELSSLAHEQKSQEALEIAEAGLNYYQWHLAHNNTDFKDGNSTPATAPYGPYTHTFDDASGAAIGTFTLYITPPASGSTVVTVESIGKVTGLNASRTVQAQIGEPSFASYVLLTGTEVWFGPNESASGPVLSDVGVHFDGTNNGPVQSASATYTPSAEFGGDGKVHNGVWGNGGPQSEWQFPVPTVDFSSVTADLSSLATLAKSNGVYLASSGKLGYYLHLKTNGTIDIYTVKSQSSSGITTTFVRNQAAPANGVFYVSDNVWVDGTGYPGRLTIASGVLPSNPSTYTTIWIDNNLTYAAKDGSDAIGLIAQNNVQVSDFAPSTLEIDGALLAQNGSIWIDSSAPVKSSLTLYGALASYNFWTWSWVNGNGTVVAGYQADTNTFDTHLTYAPPPQYPTTNTFQILNWREILTGP